MKTIVYCICPCDNGSRDCNDDHECRWPDIAADDDDCGGVASAYSSVGDAVDDNGS